jgi:flagellar biosynthesis chaperone FliJ
MSTTIDIKNEFNAINEFVNLLILSNSDKLQLELALSELERQIEQFIHDITSNKRKYEKIRENMISKNG